MNSNSFENVFDEEEEHFASKGEQAFGSKAWSSLNLFKFIGQLIEVFLPRIADFFVVAAGGNISDNSAPPPFDAEGPDPKDLKPGPPDNDDIIR